MCKYLKVALQVARPLGGGGRAWGSRGFSQIRRTGSKTQCIHASTLITVWERLEQSRPNPQHLHEDAPETLAS